ncbi:TlyA family rRNA (cytidine-2'-O)-methyltransferase [Candidatus Saccharibacteria bacterium CG10_big_fil_rev_8_21_14_0_10_47_8]|nr:MAG: TlyA family rRNA (cytidine-2'-O)-methyltransferase [Candidatus Saccharibacteria bacterium CG10_big_fil_rev_8_21_14_0_10_47_8]
MNKFRLDTSLVVRKLCATRSQAESYIKLGKVKINGEVVLKPGHFVGEHDKVLLSVKEQYVSRAGLKLASVAEVLGLDFKDKLVLDVGSSTGGFTDYALKHGAKKVIAVDVGTDQMHPNLRTDPRVELHEKTDIRSLVSKEAPWKQGKDGVISISTKPDIIMIDVSFISLRDVLLAIAKLSKSSTQIIAMLKPQFEAGKADINRGVVKNDSLRRKIMKDFEAWVKRTFLIVGKADSQVAGSKGNLERFYLLRVMSAKLSL